MLKLVFETSFKRLSAGAQRASGAFDPCNFAEASDRESVIGIEEGVSKCDLAQIFQIRVIADRRINIE